MLAVLGVAACDQDRSALFAPESPLLQIQSDTIVPCPPNDYYSDCMVMQEEHFQLLHQEIDKFAPTESCQQGATSIRQAVNTEAWRVVGPVGSGSVQFIHEGEPPYEPLRLFVANFLFIEAYVDNGSLRDLLYHEAAHLLGKDHPEDDPRGGENGEFVSACFDAEIGFFDEEEDYDPEEQDHEPGEEDGEDEGGEYEPTTCVVRYHYYKSTGELVGDPTVLYCY
jgi:hypothetical protein